MYFEKPGFENTEKTIELAVKTAKERGIKNIVFASSSGRTAEMIPNEPDINFVAVTLAYGYSAPNESRISQEKLDELHARGIKTYTGTHALSGVERAIDTKFKGLCEVELMAHTLRLFGEGMKVAVEVATMAADGGCVPTGEPIIAVGGTGGGADTAVIMRAANSNRFFDTKIDEIICKPIK